MTQMECEVLHVGQPCNLYVVEIAASTCLLQHFDRFFPTFSGLTEGRLSKIKVFGIDRKPHLMVVTWMNLIHVSHLYPCHMIYARLQSTALEAETLR